MTLRTQYPGNIVELGWDYDKDAPSETSSGQSVSMMSIFPTPAPKTLKPSVQSGKATLKPGANVVVKDKVRYHPRTAETQPHVSMAEVRNFPGNTPASALSAKDYIRSKGNNKPTSSKASIFSEHKQQRSFSISCRTK